MRTRTLLILAVLCGLTILVAGVIQLLRIAGDTQDELHAVGKQVDVGDLTVVVESFDESGATATVEVRLGGVDDDDVADAFRLVVPGEPLAPTREGDRPCGASTIEPQRCTLTFDVEDAGGGTRVLLYRRGDQTARWRLQIDDTQDAAPASRRYGGTAHG